MDKLSFLGTGYVGLCTAVCFAARGYHVVTSTYNERNVKMINKGLPPFYEPQLKEMLKNAIDTGKLTAVYGREKAIMESDIAFITVGTPSQADGGIDLNLIKTCAREIGEAIRVKDSKLYVVVKSTVIPGTTTKVVKTLIESYSGKKAGIDFGLAMNPEFLRQGAAIHDTLNPDRVIIGEYDKESGDVLENLYKVFYREKPPSILRMGLHSAEMIKYVNNAFLATKISFINEIANICEKIETINIDLIAEGIGLDNRINPRFLQAGPGWGGSCFPKDVKALVAFSKQRDSNFHPFLLDAVVKVNVKQAEHVVSIAQQELGELEGRTIAILGLSFKPNTSDTRESPALKIIDSLLEHKARVKVYDPKAIENTRNLYRETIAYARDCIDCISEADCCILVTHWKEFQKLSPVIFKEQMRTPLLIDTRRMYNPNSYSKILRYRAIGLS